MHGTHLLVLITSNIILCYIYIYLDKINCLITVSYFIDGNPITGEGYEASKPAAAPAQHVSAQSEPAQEQKKPSRVPPGGYSTGLW